MRISEFVEWLRVTKCARSLARCVHGRRLEEEKEGESLDAYLIIALFNPAHARQFLSALLAKFCLLPASGPAARIAPLVSKWMWI